jgi:hypothetical protein
MDSCWDSGLSFLRHASPIFGKTLDCGSLPPRSKDTIQIEHSLLPFHNLELNFLAGPEKRHCDAKNRSGLLNSFQKPIKILNYT